MNKHKILFLIPHLEKRGPVVWLYNLLKNIDTEHFSISILTFFPERQYSMLDQFRQMRIEIFCGNLKKWQVISQKSLIKHTIKKLNPDIIHSCSTITDALCASINFSQPFIITLHNYILEDIMLHYGKIIGGFLCLYEKRSVLKADCVVTCSNTLKTQYEKLIPRDYVSIQNGIDIDEWKNDTGLNQKALREKLQLPTDKYIIIHTGALIKRKNPLLVIDAFKEANLDDAVLLVLNDGILAAQCKQSANDNIIFTGQVYNVKEYLYAADLLVSASSSEGLPYAILEAECTGLPMFLSDIPQHKESLGGGGTKGVSFFNVGDKEALTILLKNSPRMNRQNYNINDISAKTMADNYMKQYTQITEKRKIKD